MAQPLTLALPYEHKVADCLYLALGREAAGAAIATADRRLDGIARSAGAPY